MAAKTLRIGNGAGFLGDNLDAPRRLVESATLDYFTLEYLAELTLSILAYQRSKNPESGYAADFLTVLSSLLPALKEQPDLRVVTNAGGMNPLACAAKSASLLVAAGLGQTKLGVVTGDDLLPRLADLQAAGVPFNNLDTGPPLSALKQPVASANVYLGAQPIAEALGQEARLVITGRVADASLTVGPAMHEFGWRWDDWQSLAAASVAGHLIECGAQVTGGLSHDWANLNLGDVGYPIAELSSAGEVVITKPDGSGGRVDRTTVAEQLVYEIGDPVHYLTPDVDVDFSQIEVRELAPNRVAVSGARGNSAPPMLKVSLAYRDGYTASGQLLVYGANCVEKAKACAAIIFARLKQAGYEYAGANVEYLGGGAGVPGLSPAPPELREVMLRISVRDPRREAVERFTREFAPLITAGPPGVAGYAAGRSTARPVFAYWPTLVPRELVKPRVEVRKASDWSQA